MEMSVKQSLCQCNNGAFELCVWGTQDGGPPITYTPHHLCHISLRVILQHLFCLIRCLSVCLLLYLASFLPLVLTHVLIHFV